MEYRESNHTATRGPRNPTTKPACRRLVAPGCHPGSPAASRFLDTVFGQQLDCPERPLHRASPHPTPNPGSSAPALMFHSTTILALRINDRAVMAGDGQVTFGQTVMKHHARKIRKLYHDRILAGFAGSAA